MKAAIFTSNNLRIQIVSRLYCPLPRILNLEYDNEGLAVFSKQAVKFDDEWQFAYPRLWMRPTENLTAMLSETCRIRTRSCERY